MKELTILALGFALFAIDTSASVTTKDMVGEQPVVIPAPMNGWEAN